MKYLLPVCMLLASCATTPAPNDKEAMPPYPMSPDKAGDFLEGYYNAKDSVNFGVFFEHWNSAEQPRTDFASETEKAAYEVFAQVFQPDKHIALGAWEPGADGINTGQPYVVLPVEMPVEVAGKPDTLRRFRPALAKSSGKPLYQEAGYDSVLMRFLRGPGSAEAAGSSYERTDWLRKWIPLIMKRGGEWYILSQPIINRISFDQSLQKATVSFRMGYQFGEAVVVKKGEKWELETSQVTAVE